MTTIYNKVVDNLRALNGEAVNTTPANEWREEFDEMINKAWDKHGEQYEVYDPKSFESDIKDFIQTLLDTGRARLVERFEKAKKYELGQGARIAPGEKEHNKAIDQAIDIINDNK